KRKALRESFIARDLGVEPRDREAQLARHRGQMYAQRRRDLVLRHAREVGHLDRARFALVEAAQALERVVEREQLLGALVDDVTLCGRDRPLAAATFLCAALPGAVDQ